MLRLGANTVSRSGDRIAPHFVELASSLRLPRAILLGSFAPRGRLPCFPVQRLALPPELRPHRFDRTWLAVEVSARTLPADLHGDLATLREKRAFRVAESRHDLDDGRACDRRDLRGREENPLHLAEVPRHRRLEHETCARRGVGDLEPPRVKHDARDRHLAHPPRPAVARVA